MRTTFLVLCLVSLPIIISAQESGKDAVVSASKMNILYRGIANPVEIAVPGVASDKITAAITNGTIAKVSGGWEVYPGGQTESIITVLANNKKVTEKTFRVKSIPLPVAVFTGKSNGTASKDEASKTSELNVVLKDFDWDLKFEIVSFVFACSKDGMDYEYVAKGNKLTDEMKSKISDLKRGQSAVFKDIKAVGPDGKIRDLNPVIIKLD